MTLMTRDGPLWVVFLAVGSGAALGAIVRWALSYALNPRWAMMPAGTLTANLLGGFLIGIAVAFFADQLTSSPALRLFVVTGFLGGLTTFSTFSSENIAMLLNGEYVRAVTHAATHLVGTISMTAVGLWFYRNILRAVVMKCFRS